MPSGHREGAVPGGKRERKYVREPKDSTLFCTNLFSPWMMAAIEITEETPMTIPRIVSAERTFAERRVPTAAKKFSRAWDAVMMAISPTSRQRWDQGSRHVMLDRCRRTIRPRS